MKKNSLMICLGLVLMIAFNLLISNKVSESYVDGQNIKFARNYCTRFDSETKCNTDWQKKGYIIALNNNDIQLQGNPCSWNGSVCNNSTFAPAWKYEFTAPDM